MEYVFTENAPKAVGHYSQAIVHNGLVFVSGQLPMDPRTGGKKIGSIEEQTEQVLENIKNILKASGSSLQHVLKATVYISDISLFGKVNEIYSKYFGEHKPARAVVPTRELHLGFQIEMEVIASRLC